MSLRKTVLTLALGALGAAVYTSLRSHYRLREQTRSPAEPEHLQTWETEGGGLPGSVVAGGVPGDDIEPPDEAGNAAGTRAPTEAAQQTDTAR